MQFPFCFFFSKWSCEYHQYFQFRQKSYAWVMIIMYSKSYLSLNLWKKFGAYISNISNLHSAQFFFFSCCNVSRQNILNGNISVCWMSKMQICSLVCILYQRIYDSLTIIQFLHSCIKSFVFLLKLWLICFLKTCISPLVFFWE